LGVFRNGRPLTARHGVAVRDARVLASRSEVQRGEWDRFSDAAFRIEPISSIAWKLALVAAGDAEATWALGPKHEWDVAAGAALATAAGLRVRYADGSPPVFNRANPACRGIIAAPDPEHSPEWGRYWELLAG
ncbi:MAG: hypothetical protein KDB53_10335, partial [Planctomycetes bacterium]|nr:hypothetical protein [Planctomycetota bacterium]